MKISMAPTASARLSSRTELAVGDVLAFRGGNWGITHLAYYVGDNYVFTKNGWTRYSPYVFQPLQVVVDGYGPRERGLSAFRLKTRAND